MNAPVRSIAKCPIHATDLTQGYGLFGLLDALGEAEARIGASIDDASPRLSDLALEQVTIAATLADGRPITGVRVEHDPDGLTFRVVLLAGANL